MTLRITILLFTIFLFGCGDDPTKQVFINYAEHSREINEAKLYFSEIKPEGSILYIRFHPENKIDFSLHQGDYEGENLRNRSKIFDQYGTYKKYDVSLFDNEVNEAFKVAKLSRAKIQKLKNYLIKGNCISIAYYSSFSGDDSLGYTSIGYPTGDLYGINYVIFDNKISDAKSNEIVKSCSFKSINAQVLVEYGGPAFGSNCFPDK